MQKPRLFWRTSAVPPCNLCRLLEAHSISSSLLALNRILTGWSLKCHPWRLSHNWIYLYLISFPSADASPRLLIKRPELVWLVTSLSELFSALFLSPWGRLYLNTPVKGSKLSAFHRSLHTLWSAPWQLHRYRSSSNTHLISLLIHCLIWPPAKYTRGNNSRMSPKSNVV